MHNYFLLFPYHIYDKVLIANQDDFESQLNNFPDFLKFRLAKNEFFVKSKKTKNPLPFVGNYYYLFKLGNQYKQNDIESLCNLNDFDKKYFEKTALLRGYNILKLNANFQLNYFNYFFHIFLKILINYRRVLIYLLLIYLYT